MTKVSAVEAFSRFLEFKQSAIQSKSLNKYRATLAKLQQYASDTCLDEFTVTRALAFKDALLTELSPSTVLSYLVLLQACWRWHQTGMSPWKTVIRQVDVRERRDRALSDADKLAILDELESGAYSHYLNYVRFLFAVSETGLRLEEIAALKWGDLDGDGVMLTKAIARGQIKSIKPRRVELTGEALTLLGEMGRRERGELLFPGKQGGAIRDDVFRRVWERALSDAEIAYCVPSDVLG